MRESVGHSDFRVAGEQFTLVHNTSYPPNRQKPPRDNDFRVTVMKR